MTLGLSPCPNDTYIFHALLHHLVPSPAHFTPHMADVEELNALARQKKLPVTKLSLGVVPYIMDDYAIMASGAALGWGCGPLVVAREDLPEEKWKTARVAVPGLMTTANLLLTLHGGFQGPREEMLFSDVMDAVLTGEADMGVIIHEGRFTYADRGLVKLLDLGQWWEATYHAPLPLGAIEEFGSGRLRRTISETAGSAETYLAHQLPDKAKVMATIIGLLALLAIFDWRLVLLSLAPVSWAHLR